MDQPLSVPILVIMYCGDVLFAIAGALAAGRRKMDVVGYVGVGTVTGLGGGTLRDLLLGRTVWWTTNPLELILCSSAALGAYLWLWRWNRPHSGVVWFDAVGLSAFGVVGAHVAMGVGAPFIVASFMGMITATGGGVIRDVLTGVKPMIFSAGELYATAALGGSVVYLAALRSPALAPAAEVLGFLTTLALRTISIAFGLRLGPPGEFVSWGKAQAQPGQGKTEA